MRAMVAPRFGAPEVFEERDVEMPQPGPGEILVRVVASGTNPIDAKFRAAGGSRGLEAPVILGADVSGVVEEVGPGITALTPGDEVYYTPEVSGPRSNGGYAEYHVAKADILARKPPSLSHEEAAAVPLAGGTAYEAIVRRLGVKVGETVLISRRSRWRWLLRHPDRQIRQRPRARHRRPRQPGDAPGPGRRRGH